MPKRLKQIKSNQSTQVNYSLRNSSFGYNESTYSDGWSTKIHEKRLTGFYDIADKDMLKHNCTPFATFYSGDRWAIIDEELKKLKITHQSCVMIQFTLVLKETLSIPLFMQIMTHPAIEAMEGVVLLTGLFILTAATIALIPSIAAALTLIGLSAAPIAIAGGILLSIGMLLSLATIFYRMELEKDPCDLTMQQVGFPESKESLSPQAKEILFPQFFADKQTNKPSVTIEEIDEENQSPQPL